MDYPVVDLTVAPSGVPLEGGVSGQSPVPSWSVDGAEVAASIEQLRQELAERITNSEDSGLRLSEMTVKLTITAEGKVAFVAKGGIEASIEAKFEWRA